MSVTLMQPPIFARPSPERVQELLDLASRSTILLPPTAPQGPMGSIGSYGFATSKNLTYTADNPLSIPGDRRTLIPVDDVAFNSLRGPFASHIWLRDERFRARAYDDTFDLRLSMRCMGTMMLTRVAVDLDISSEGATESTIIASDNAECAYGAGTVSTLTFNFNAYSRTMFLANGASFIATPTSEVLIWDISLAFFPTGVGS